MAAPLLFLRTQFKIAVCAFGSAEHSQLLLK